MRPAELDALIEQGLEALRAAKGLSEEEEGLVARAIARLEALEAASVEAPAEEPEAAEAAEDSEPEPKAEPKKVRRSTPRRSAGRKGK